MASAEKYRGAPPPEHITECTACKHNGCLTDYVCHISSVESACAILSCGKLLSAAKVRKIPKCLLVAEKRNAAGDPVDYFDYIMFTWGNCQAGDRLVMERKLGRFPDEEDVTSGFSPGIRFYFRYDELSRHPCAVYDGVHPIKIRDQLLLDDSLAYLVIPRAQYDRLQTYIPDGLLDRMVIVEDHGQDIWSWAKAVYDAILYKEQA